MQHAHAQAANVTKSIIHNAWHGLHVPWALLTPHRGVGAVRGRDDPTPAYGQGALLAGADEGACTEGSLGGLGPVPWALLTPHRGVAAVRGRDDPTPAYGQGALLVSGIWDLVRGICYMYRVCGAWWMGCGTWYVMRWDVVHGM